ncbi:MAG: hypothetical protein ABL921_20450 [Pirellula sp.]
MFVLSAELWCPSSTDEYVMSKEADWKRFQGLIIKARERYLAEQNALLMQIFEDPDRNETERFWDAFKRMKKVSNVLSDCLDDHSRSKMEIHMRLMLRFGMLVREDLVSFSEDIQERLRLTE